MQRDVVRLRHYYQRSGFARVKVRYDARYEAKSDQIRVTYVIDEGPPITIDTLAFTTPAGPLTLPAGTQRSWRRFARGARSRADRAGEDERREVADSTVRWFRAHGFPFASART